MALCKFVGVENGLCIKGFYLYVTAVVCGGLRFGYSRKSKRAVCAVYYVFKRNGIIEYLRKLGRVRSIGGARLMGAYQKA